MKKSTTVKRQRVSRRMVAQMAKRAGEQKLTVGLDLGDRHSCYVILDEAGEVIHDGELGTTKTGLNALFAKMPPSRVALEVGTHSPWVSRQVAGFGHEVIVANPREVKLIGKSTKKSDRVDAEKLARLARVDPQLLAPIRHRGEQAQRDLAVIRARATLVEARTKLINSARGLVKSLGERLPASASDRVGSELAKELKPELRLMVEPMLEGVAELSARIDAYDQQIQGMESRYPEVELMKQVYGVGTLVGLTYILTIEDPTRFRRSREVGGYLGMVRKRRESSEREPELRISKEGDRALRTLLVQSAQCILRRGAPDSDLRRWGLAKIEASGVQQKSGRRRGGKNTKKRVVMAVARKLAVLLHRLWVHAEVYEPLYNQKQSAAVTVAA